MTDKPALTANANELGWRYEKPADSGKCLLLTIGLIAVVGHWSGDYGQAFVAWMPLPKRDKELERALGVGFP